MAENIHHFVQSRILRSCRLVCLLPIQVVEVRAVLACFGAAHAREAATHQMRHVQDGAPVAQDADRATCRTILVSAACSCFGVLLIRQAFLPMLAMPPAALSW